MIINKSVHEAGPIVSTTGFEGEGALRRFRRESVTDVLARYISQTSGQPATLLDIGAADSVEEVEHRPLVSSAINAFNQLSPARLAISGDQLKLSTDGLSELLLDPREKVNWPETIVSAHRDAIGGSRGALVRFAHPGGRGNIEVFTTRPDTLFGATFLAVSPSHPIALLAEPSRLLAFQEECEKQGDDANTKAGVSLDIKVLNPLDPERVIPVWLANFVVEDYGTGAAGGCPACDQRDLDFARRYNLPVLPIICPPGMDPDTYRVGTSAHAGDGTIINSEFLSGLSVEEAINAAIARLVELDRGKPTVQYRLRPLVVAEAASESDCDVHYLGRFWRFTDAFLTAAASVAPTNTRTWRPHLLHVTVPEAATRHLLDARILLAALGEGHNLTYQEPWEEIVFVGDVLDPSSEFANIPIWKCDALRLAVLADTPPDREIAWNEHRYTMALKLVEGAHTVFGSERSAGAIDHASLGEKVAQASATMESALRRRRTNAAVAAAREIIRSAAEFAATGDLDNSSRALVASLLYSLLPDLAAKGLSAAGVAPADPPAWPRIAQQSVVAENIELIVQINGKKRGAVQVPRDADEKMLIAAIRADRSLNEHLGENPVRKIIVVPNRLVNLVF